MARPVLRQLGFVTPDIAAAADDWVRRTGAGPFFLLPGMTFSDWSYNGNPQEMTLDIAFGQSGDVMIELITPRGSWPNVYGPAMPTALCVPHHHGFLVGDVDGWAQHLNAPLVTRASLSPQTELRYFDCRDTLGQFVELITDTAESRAFFDHALAAAQEWDGISDPVRPFTAEGAAA